MKLRSILILLLALAVFAAAAPPDSDARKKRRDGPDEPKAHASVMIRTPLAGPAVV